MSWRPVSQESLDALRRLQAETEQRGDLRLSLLLAGVDLYVKAGREMELLELMRNHAEEMREAIENTPSAQDLRRLYDS
jgi:hypothetical protein